MEVVNFPFPTDQQNPAINHMHAYIIIKKMR